MEHNLKTYNQHRFSNRYDTITLRRTARHYDALLGTTTYCSALRHTARHYDVLISTSFSSLMTPRIHFNSVRVTGRFSNWAESHIGISVQSEKSQENRPRTKVRDENSLGRNSCNSMNKSSLL